MNTLFYTAFNGKTDGPFTVEQLQERGVLSGSLVWKEGFADWVKVENVPELAGMIRDNLSVFSEPLANAGEQSSQVQHPSPHVNNPYLDSSDRYFGHQLASKMDRFWGH